LAAYKYPRQITIVETVPLTSVGKLDRKKLRQLIADAGLCGAGAAGVVVVLLCAPHAWHVAF